MSERWTETRFETAEEVAAASARWNLDAIEWVWILSEYTTVARLRRALPILRARNPGHAFVHRELAEVVCASREKVTVSLKRMSDEEKVGLNNPIRRGRPRRPL